jgi:hypothetical protein
MARLGINTGAIGNDGTGDSLRAAGGKINSNFLELYTYLGAGSTDTLSAPIWDKTISGINTLSNVGIGTIDPRFSLEVGSVGASGTSLWVNGDARITGILTVGTSSITLDGTNNTITVGLGVTIDGNSGVINASSINLGGTTLTGAAVTYITAGSGISVDQSTGNVTITATGGGGGSQTLNDTLGLGNTSSFGMSVGVVTASSFVKTGGTSSEFLKADGSVDTSTYATETYVGLATTGLLSSTGNGSSLTGIVTYIEAGSGVSIDQSTGKVTITSTGGGGSGESYWVSTNAGIHTLSNVGIGTTNPGEKLQVDGNIRVGISSTSNYISFKGTYRDGNPQPDSPEFKPYEHTYIGERIYDYSGLGEKSELLLYKGNDLSNTSWGPDRIRLLSSEHRFDILQSTATGSFEDVGLSTATNAVTINSTGVGIGTTNPTNTLTVNGGIGATTLNVSGISTFNSTVNLNGTTFIPSNQSLVFGSNKLSINYNSTGYSLISNGSAADEMYISGDGAKYITSDSRTSHQAKFIQGGAVELYYNGNKKFETLGAGVTITGTTFTNQLNVSGVSTLGVVTAGNIYSTGIITATTFVGNFSGSITDATNLTGGTANASSLNVSGITTISQGRIQADASSNLRFGNLPAGSGSGRNIAIGDQVLASLSGGSGRNIGIGELSYYDTTTGQYNIGIGERAGQKVSTGSYNVILGAYDGNSGNLDIRTSSNNVVIADGQGNIRQYINSSGNVGIKTTVVTEALTVAGIVSATSFYGTLNAGQLTGTLPAIDGSALLNVVGSGSGVVVQEDGTPVGTAGTINFENNISVSFASGIATVSGASSVSAATTAYALAGTPNLNVGVVTATTLNITNDYLVLPRGTSKGIHFGVPPYDNGANDSVIFVSDSVTNSGELVLNSGDYSTKIIGKSLIFRSNFADQCSIGTETSYILSRVGIGSTQPTSKLDVSGDAKVSGVVTASSFSGSGSGLTNLPAGQLTGALPALDGSLLINLPAQPGDGINVRDDNTPVGSARTVNFGTGLDVSITGGVATINASGGSLQSRTVVSGTTSSIANNAIGNINITGFKSYALMKVGLSTTGWLRLYTDSTSRSNDASRSVGIDPAPGSGVIAEVVTTGISTTQIISPFVMGGNLDNPADTTIYAAITNLSGSTQAITANLTILQLEA